MNKGIRVERVPFPISRTAPAGLSARHAAIGRREQARARRAVLNAPPATVLATFLLQSAAWTVRRTLPTLYEWIRRHRRL